MPKNELFEKAVRSIIPLLLFSVVGGFIFFSLVRHFILKYFESIQTKLEAAFKRIDELRHEHREFKNIDFRDYKRDVAIAIQQNREDIKQLFDRTDNHQEIKDCVDYCRRKNKKG